MTRREVLNNSARAQWSDLRSNRKLLFVQALVSGCKVEGASEPREMASNHGAREREKRFSANAYEPGRTERGSMGMGRS